MIQVISTTTRVYVQRRKSFVARLLLSTREYPEKPLLLWKHTFYDPRRSSETDVVFFCFRPEKASIRRGAYIRAYDFLGGEREEKYKHNKRVRIMGMDFRSTYTG